MTRQTLKSPGANRSNAIGLLLLVLVVCPIARARAQPREQLIGERQAGLAGAQEDEYLVGVGIADITGPSADINLMGYAKPNQDAGGIHLRQFSRALVMQDARGTRLAYVNLDNGMVSQLLRSRVMERLRDTFGAGVYNESNVMLSATHTHSGPGGYFQYMLYNIPSAGFINQTLEALVGGVVRSVARAHARLQRARLYFHKGDLADASVNRSPTSYANNPAKERARYAHDTDRAMYLLRVDDLQQRPLAVVSWFAVHGTSMNISNHLISSDNKGYAALLFEQEVNLALTGQRALPGQGPFVALFAQANEGDVSPNTRGPRCIDTGLPCDDATSTCGSPPRNEKCIASGPGRDMFESTKIIAHKQFYKARQLFLDTQNQRPVRGPLRFVHEHVDMSAQVVPLYQSLIDLARRHERQVAAGAAAVRRRSSALGRRELAAWDDAQIVAQQHSIRLAPAYSSLNATYRTCPAALGYSFAAGTTDGPGAFDFQQGDTASSRYWNLVRNFLRKPSDELVRCQHPKPILLSTGEMDFPYMWHPRVVPTQIFTIGQVALVGLPGEFTTMSGRRVRQAVEAALAGEHAGAQPQPQQASKLAPASGGDAAAGSGNGSGSGSDGQTDAEDLASDEALQRGRARATASRRPRAAAAAAAAAANEANEAANGSSQQVAPAPALASTPPARNYEVVLSGLSNIYTSYITTIEEFEMQRYEGASTLYGPHTLQAYVNQFVRLARVLATSEPASSHELTPASLKPPDLTKSLFTIKPGVIFDGAPRGRAFGDLLVDVDSARTYRCRELVSATFVAGNPRNDLRQEASYLYVELFQPRTGAWQVVATDGSWETKFIWERTSLLFGESKATIEWELPEACETGVYRLRHVGAHKALMSQTVAPYAGRSSAFRVLGAEHAGGGGGGSRELVASIEAALESTLRLAEQANGADQRQASSSSSGGDSTPLPAEPQADVKSSERRLTPGSLLASVAHYFESLLQRKW